MGSEIAIGSRIAELVERLVGVVERFVGGLALETRSVGSLAG